MTPAAKKILIVDHDPNIGIALEFLMAQHGFQVKIARSGEEALESIAGEVPDLLLLEVRLPYRNGFEICQLVRQRPEWRHLKIILLTARGREVDVAKGMALGADAYITKPFAARELVTRVQTILQKAP
jgi:DNA-binding response OmpR family regulator